MRIILILLFSHLYYSVGLAQVNTAEEVDYQTYELFINQNYRETIKVGKRALDQNIDFYYLRYRMGVSYFETKNYAAATTHLEKALSEDKNNELLQEYLYYAYLFSNQNEKANLLADSGSAALKAKVKYKRNLVSSIGIETGYLFTDNLDKFKKTDLLQANTFGQANVYSDVVFGNLTFTNQLTPRFQLFHNMSVVSNTSNLITQIGGANPTNSVYSNKNLYYQYNGIANYFLRTFTLSAGVGYYLAQYADYAVAPTFSSSGAIVYPKSSLENYSGSFGIKKRFKYFEPIVSGSYSNFLKTDNYTTEVSISYFPFGNLRLYGNSKWAYVTNTDTHHQIYSQLIGTQLTKHLFMEFFGAWGNHTNYIADNGQMVYYTPNQINWYAGSNMNVYFSRLSFSLGYNLQERESFYVSGVDSITFKYKYNLIKTKITWNF